VEGVSVQKWPNSAVRASLACCRREKVTNSHDRPARLFASARPHQLRTKAICLWRDDAHNEAQPFLRNRLGHLKGVEMIAGVAVACCLDVEEACHGNPYGAIRYAGPQSLCEVANKRNSVDGAGQITAERRCRLPDRRS